MLKGSPHMAAKVTMISDLHFIQPVSLPKRNYCFLNNYIWNSRHEFHLPISEAVPVARSLWCSTWPGLGIVPTCEFRGFGYSRQGSLPLVSPGLKCWRSGSSPKGRMSAGRQKQQRPTVYGVGKDTCAFVSQKLNYGIRSCFSSWCVYFIPAKSKCIKQ